MSVHIYKSSWNSGTGQFLAPSDIDTLIASGKPCIVGEFGPEGTGDCNWKSCVDYAIEKGLTVIGWCCNGDGGNNNMVSPSWNSHPTAINFVKNGGYFDTIYGKI